MGNKRYELWTIVTKKSCQQTKVVNKSCELKLSTKVVNKSCQQAGAELGQAQIKLELGFILIKI